MSNAQSTSVVGCQFTAGPTGKFLFSSALSIEGSSFFESENGDAKMFESKTGKALILNSTSNIPVGNLGTGAFVNSRLPDIDRFFVLQVDGSRRVINPDHSEPKPQMQWGAAL